MSKGLEALKRLMTDYYEMCQDLGSNEDQYQRWNLTSERAIIAKELNEYEQYKTIEQELGIDLITLFKALKSTDGLWVSGEAKENINKIERSLKALEIIRKHGLSYPHLNLILQSENYGLYRRIIVGSHDNAFKYEIPYSREDFELIKAVFQ